MHYCIRAPPDNRTVSYALEEDVTASCHSDENCTQGKSVQSLYNTVHTYSTPRSTYEMLVLVSSQWARDRHAVSHRHVISWFSSCPVSTTRIRGFLSYSLVLSAPLRVLLCRLLYQPAISVPVLLDGCIVHAPASWQPCARARSVSLLGPKELPH
jgi:hypothetical protein